MVSEVMSQPENPRHVTTADLGGGFAYLSIELGRLLDDQDTGIGRATFEHHGRRGTGKGAADDRHIVIHGEENDAGDRRERQFPADPTTKSGSTHLRHPERSRSEVEGFAAGSLDFARDDVAKVPLSLR